MNAATIIYAVDRVQRVRGTELLTREASGFGSLESALTDARERFSRSRGQSEYVVFALALSPSGAVQGEACEAAIKPSRARRNARNGGRGRR